MLKTVSSITNAIGALNYKGTWNASTNTPTLTSSSGTKGDYYQVSVAGSTSLDGISNWGVGDVAAFNGTTWQRIEGGADLNGVNLSVSGSAQVGTKTSASGATVSTVFTAGIASASGGVAAAATLCNTAVAANNNEVQLTFAPASNYSGTGAIGVSIEDINSANSNLKFYVYNGALVEAAQFASSGTLLPKNDNTQALGGGAKRWSVVYAGTGTINTSDARSKQQVRALDEAERRVAQKLKGMLKAFKFNDAVEKKGDDARIHFGVIAQDVAEAFASEGLVAAKYALFCHDSWEDQYEFVWATRMVTDEETGEEKPEQYIAETKLALPAGDRYGIRYDELLAFVIAAL